MEHTQTTHLDIEPQAKGELHYAKESIDLANELIPMLQQDGWEIKLHQPKSFGSTSIWFKKGNLTGRICQFSTTGSRGNSLAGCFKLEIDQGRLQTVYSSKVTPFGDPKEQAEYLMGRVNRAINHKLSNQEFQGLGLYSEVKIDGRTMFVASGMFNQRSVTLVTERDFNSFEIDLDGAVCHGYVNGEWKYLGRDPVVTMNIDELEAKTGRIWGKREYKRKSAAIKLLNKLTRCVAIQVDDMFLVVAASRLVHINIKEEWVVGFGKDVPEQSLKNLLV